ncbi:MAG: ANTAR domain-containing protein [Actinomycetes bacterium]
MSVGELTSGRDEHVGRFTWNRADDSWWWCPEVLAIYGIAADSDPTPETFSERLHPDDRDALAAAVDAVAGRGGAFSRHHRVVRPDGQVRHVVLACDAVQDDAGEPTGLRGYVIDVTETERQLADATATEAVRRSKEHAAAIEQAKGALMYVYGLDPDAAFALLRWRSRNDNLKLHDLCEELVVAMSTGEVSAAALHRYMDPALTALEGRGQVSSCRHHASTASGTHLR